jgi:hypothetical protein
MSGLSGGLLPSIVIATLGCIPTPTNRRITPTINPILTDSLFVITPPMLGIFQTI